jgi:hypothetical protein
MTDLRETVASRLAARYTKLAGWVSELAAPLSDEQFWAKPFPFGNSFGHLVLHLTGNLNYYIQRRRAEEVRRSGRDGSADDSQPVGERVVGGIRGCGRRRAEPLRDRSAVCDAFAPSHWADDVFGVRTETNRVRTAALGCPAGRSPAYRVGRNVASRACLHSRGRLYLREHE